MRGSEVLVKDELSSSAKPTAQDDPTPEAVWNAKAPAPGPYWTSPLAPKISGRLAGILLMAGSLVPWLLNGEHGPIVLGYAELVPVFGMVLCVVGRLVIMP